MRRRVMLNMILPVLMLTAHGTAHQALAKNPAGVFSQAQTIRYDFEPVTETYPVPGAKAYAMPDPSLRSDVRLAKTRKGHLYAGAGKRLWNSTDGGRTWTQSELPFDSAGGFGILADDTFILAYDEPDNVGTSVIRSTDYGRSWSEPFALDISPYDYSGAGWCHVYQHPDGTAMMTVTLRHRDKVHQWNTPECGVHDHIFRSTDGGRTWGDRTLLAWHVGESSLLALRDANRMLTYMRHQRSWMPNDAADLWEKTGAPSKDSGPLKNGMIAESSDGGRTWKNLRLWGTYGTVPGSIIQVPDGRVAVLWQQRYPHSKLHVRVRISEDGGRTWGKKTYRLPELSGYPSSVVYDDGTIVTVCGSTKMDAASKVIGRDTLHAVRWELPIE